MNLPKPKNDELMFLPLGGSGEIGMNFNLYGNAGKWLIVDCVLLLEIQHMVQ